MRTRIPVVCRRLLVRREASLRGMTLIEVVVGIAVLMVAFVSLYGLYQGSLRFVASAKAREVAVGLAVERLESMRAMSYASVGTVNGIPSGAIPQNETISLDNISFNRRTLVQYVDDPADGSGGGDLSGVTADYKRAKVEVSWAGPSGTSTIELISNFIPVGLENLSGGGTLSLLVFDALGSAVPDAAVRVTNFTGTSSVDVTTYTNAAGVVQFPGTPATTGYQILVSKSGYSSAQTYGADSGNPNPNPGNLSVLANQTTSASFAIDRTSTFAVRTWRPILAATTTDTLASSAALASTSAAEVVGGALALSGSPGSYALSGAAYSTTTAPSYLSSWNSLSWNASVPASAALTLRLYTQSGSDFVLLPDSALPGNAAGFATSPVSLAGLSTSTYPSLVMGASLSGDGSATPQLLDWSLSYARGPSPLPSVTFSMHGAKTVGTTASGADIYKLSANYTTDSSATYSAGGLEWDSYTMSVASTTGWDLSSSCPLQPVSVPPASQALVDLYLVTHTQHSLLVTVRNATSSAPLPNASVTLTRTGFSAASVTDACGQAFFSGLAASLNYSLAASAPGFGATTTPGISVSGQSAATISI